MFINTTSTYDSSCVSFKLVSILVFVALFNEPFGRPRPLLTPSGRCVTICLSKSGIMHVEYQHKRFGIDEINVTGSLLNKPLAVAYWEPHRPHTMGSSKGFDFKITMLSVALLEAELSTSFPLGIASISTTTAVPVTSSTIS